MKEIKHSSKYINHVQEVPSLTEIQLDSYKWFLEEGLPELFQSFSPIWDFTGNHYIELLDFVLGEPKYSVSECRDRDMTFEVPIRARVRLGGKEREVIESEVYLGDLPLMTDMATFIINGRERVIVSQLTRSPGLYFSDDVDFSMQILVMSKVIPSEGPWLEIESDPNSVVRTQIHQTKKLPFTLLLKAMTSIPEAKAPVHLTLDRAIHCRLEEPIVDAETGEVLAEKGSVVTDGLIASLPETMRTQKVLVSYVCSTNEDLLFTFGRREILENPTKEQLNGKRALEDIIDPKTSKVIVKKLGRIERATVEKIEKLGLERLEVLNVNRYIEATLDQDPSHDAHEALLDIYRRLRPGEPANEESARQQLFSLFFDSRRYDLAKVGRYQLNKKLDLDVPLDVRHLTVEDLVQTLFYMGEVREGNEGSDDIDHLRNKRIRSVGELLQSQLRLGFLRMEKVARERMTSQDPEHILPSVILSIKPISASIKSFFSSSQLSTFMDQTNPLSELVNKRRLSALGPGGLSRTSAKLEVRDVHRSHYGRICPIETPEGPNIGLIGQLTVYAKIDDYGFIETPVQVVKAGKVTKEIIYLSASEDDQMKIAPADVKLDDEGNIIPETVQVRYLSAYPLVPRLEVEYMDVSPVQIISIATACIPFLENDDANRALMGANMQRQAVPLLVTESPIVKTGYERYAAVDSGAAIIARKPGLVEYVTSGEIKIRPDEPDGTEIDGFDYYKLMHMQQSNKSTCFTQNPIVVPGQRVVKAQPIADGASCDKGELALGRNVMVAFMPWGGYNYEDAILVSERLVKDDVYTSIHIERHETEAVDTKLGPEEITRDIPNVGEEALKDLDENGIIRIGAEVRPEDILVGKVAPKGHVEMTAEERLIIAIFGKKAEETRDVSLRLPHGEKGQVIDVKVFARFKYLCQNNDCKHIHNLSKRPERMICDRCEGELKQLPGDELPAGVNHLVRVFTAQKRRLMEGDKMAGRHGNKGVISKIMPEEDMPFLPDGTPVDIVLNPLGVPSRMNIGQILETHLGWAGDVLDCKFVNPAFEGSTEAEILTELDRMAEKLRRDVLTNYLSSELDLNVKFTRGSTVIKMLAAVREELQKVSEDKLEQISKSVAGPIVNPLLLEQAEEKEEVFDEETPEVEEEPNNAPAEVLDGIVERIRQNVWVRCGVDEHTGKCTVRDGRSGDAFENPVTVGMIYILKLEHLADEKIHARSIGPYSLVTQQPLGGKAQFGGQRFGEMEVWALEAYGAAYMLQEILTIKSDDVMGRVKTYESIVKGETMHEPGIPESFKILVNEMRSLCLKVSVEDAQDKEIDLKQLEELATGDDWRLSRSAGFFA
ncbi:MAG: DNA-directed RNA polymerase subunit beta [bacterium]